MKLDLQAWCAYKYKCQHPWREGEHVYATDGHTVIEVPAADYPEVVAPNTLCGLDIIGLRWPPSPAWEPMPALLPDSMQTCLECQGTKFQEMDCPECEGQGTITCSECDAKHKCSHCKGTGGVLSDEPCPACSGAGELLRPTDQRVCGVVIRGEDVARLAALPDVRVCLAQGDWPTVAFVFDGGRGLVAGKGDD